MQIVFVGLGGMLGSILRYGMNTFVLKYLSQWIIFPTIVVNLIGSLLIGVILGIGFEKMGVNQQVFIVTGFLGGFTTYSAFSSEAFQLLKSGETLSTLTYVFLTLVGGLALTGVGYYLSRSLVN